MIVSLFLIILYIAVRFDFKFAVPVIVAMLHDIAITVGVYSLSGSEVTTATVAAVLTVLGYSIYDTIIIFDRVRENIPLMRGSVVRDDREHLAVGDDPPLAGDDVHHAPAGHLAAALRRRHAEDVRARAAGRDHLRRLLVDLHRRAALDDLEGARAGVPAPDRQPRGRAPASASSPLDHAEAAAARQPAPETPVLPEVEAAGDGRRRRRGDVEVAGEARAAAAAPQVASSWQSPLEISSSGSRWRRSARSR